MGSPRENVANIPYLVQTGQGVNVQRILWWRYALTAAEAEAPGAATVHAAITMLNGYIERLKVWAQLSQWITPSTDAWGYHQYSRGTKSTSILMLFTTADNRGVATLCTVGTLKAPLGLIPVT